MLNDPIVQEILTDITDDEESSIPIIECIMNGITSDLDIAEETDIKLTIVRKVLYSLYDAGIASYKRTKDPENSGEIYNWKFDQKRVYDIITKKYEKICEEIEKSIEYEQENMFFICEANEHRYKFEKASEYNFKCPKCGNSLEYQDNSAIVKELLKEKDACDHMGKIKRK
jgi:transcription initiation factor TFIIE subunit alpha